MEEPCASEARVGSAVALDERDKEKQNDQGRENRHDPFRDIRAARMIDDRGDRVLDHVLAATDEVSDRLLANRFIADAHRFALQAKVARGFLACTALPPVRRPKQERRESAGVPNGGELVAAQTLGSSPIRSS